MVDVARIALREPRSLAPEQLGDLPITRLTTRIPVGAWILWEDGTDELVHAMAIAYSRQAVRVRWGSPPRFHEAWVWRGAVERT